MWSRRIEDLITPMQHLVEEFLRQCKAAGHDTVITCTSRTKATQEALYAQGRKPLEEVNKLRRQVGLWSIGEAENKRPVTWTMQSKHVVNMMSPDPMQRKARAFDFAVRTKERVLLWNPKVDLDEDNIPDYEECGIIAEKLGLIWGGRFKTPDYCHVEWKEGI